MRPLSTPPLRSLLWFDCIGATVAGMGILAVSRPMATFLAIPRGVLVTTALVNLAYGAYSFSLARRTAPPARRIRLLVRANLAWSVICAALAIAFAVVGAPLGALWFLGEGLFVGILGACEARSAQNAARDSAGT